MSSIAASDATTNPNSQNTRPNTGADRSAVAKRGQPALLAGSPSSSTGRFVGVAPAHLLDGDDQREKDAGTADDEREQPRVEWGLVGECNDPDEKEQSRTAIRENSSRQ